MVDPGPGAVPGGQRVLHADGGYRLVNRCSGLDLSLTGGSAAVARAPQRGWNDPGTAGDTRPVSARPLAFTAAATPSPAAGAALRRWTVG